jgi:hypothetical protein
MAHVARRMAQDAWRRTHGAGRMARGAWRMAHGAWRSALGLGARAMKARAAGKAIALRTKEGTRRRADK